MKCLNCNKQATGRSKYCSDSCKVLYNRKQSTDKTVNNPKTVNKPNLPLPNNFGLPNCECMHCKTNRINGNKHVINHSTHKTASELKKNELNRVTLPGDSDYNGDCTPEWKAKHNL